MYLSYFRVPWLSPPFWMDPTQESPINLLLYSQGKRHAVPGRTHAKVQILYQILISTLKDTKEPTGHRNVTGQTLQHPASRRTENGTRWPPRRGQQGNFRLFPFSLFTAGWVSLVTAGNNYTSGITEVPSARTRGQGNLSPCRGVAPPRTLHFPKHCLQALGRRQRND